MKPLLISSGACRKFNDPARLRRTATATPGAPDLPHLMKPNFLARLLRRERQPVASFGAADLIRRRGGHWELRGGPPEDHAAAREWCSMFQHDATFRSTPLPACAEEPSPSSAAPHLILIADDDPVVRGSLATVLESEGYVVDEASNGIEAVTHSIEHAPDLILLDLNMPRWDGWTAFSRLDRVTPLVPVIVITARPNQYQKAVELGVDAFMEKPLNIPVLVSAVKRLINEDNNRHVRRITSPTFVTEFLGTTDP